MKSVFSEDFQPVTCLSFYTFETSVYDNLLMRNMQVLEFNTKEQTFEMELRKTKISISIDSQNNIMISNVPEMKDPSLLRVSEKPLAHTILMNATLYDHQMSALDFRCYLNSNETDQLRYLRFRFLQFKTDGITEMLMSEFNRH